MSGPHPVAPDRRPPTPCSRVAASPPSSDRRATATRRSSTRRHPPSASPPATPSNKHSSNARTDDFTSTRGKRDRGPGLGLTEDLTGRRGRCAPARPADGHPARNASTNETPAARGVMVRTWFHHDPSSDVAEPGVAGAGAGGVDVQCGELRALQATLRPQTDHEMVVTGGQRWSPTVTPTGYVTRENPGIPGFFRTSRVPSHGRSRQFDPAIAHSTFPLVSGCYWPVPAVRGQRLSAGQTTDGPQTTVRSWGRDLSRADTAKVTGSTQYHPSTFPLVRGEHSPFPVGVLRTATLRTGSRPPREGRPPA